MDKRRRDGGFVPLRGLYLSTPKGSSNRKCVFRVFDDRLAYSEEAVIKRRTPCGICRSSAGTSRFGGVHSSVTESPDIKYTAVPLYFLGGGEGMGVSKRLRWLTRRLTRSDWPRDGDVAGR